MDAEHAPNPVAKITYLAERDDVDHAVEARKLVHFTDGSLRSVSLPIRSDIRDHSPSGVEFGYAGSGPALLALSILADAVGPERAVGLYQKFKRDFVARADGDEFRVTQEQIEEWVAKQAPLPQSVALDAWGESLGE